MMKVSFSFEIAKKYGIEEAILIDFFYKKMLKGDCFNSGIRIRIEDLANEFTCMSTRKIAIALRHLRDIGAIKTQKIYWVLNYTFSPELIEECKKYYGSGMIHPEKEGENYEQKENID